MSTILEPWPGYFQGLPAPQSLTASVLTLNGPPTGPWLKVRKAMYEYWLNTARSQKIQSQLELFAWKQPTLTTPGGEEYIWKDGQLYKAVRPWDQPQTPIAPWVRPQPVQPATPQPGDTWIGDVPSWYTITWCSNTVNCNHSNVDNQNQLVYLQ